MTSVMLKPMAPQSRVKHSTTEPMPSPSPSTEFNSSDNSKIQGLFKTLRVIFQYFSRHLIFKDFSRLGVIFHYFLWQSKFSRTFQEPPVYSSTFQACVNPVMAPLTISDSTNLAMHLWLGYVSFCYYYQKLIKLHNLHVFNIPRESV